ncbi:MAG: 4Fe-4S cluster-binding domain-containing protein [Methanobrevibacter sp.]|nr:4Fe-4S cluster-binding domain-containing protein [Methanobrevibacter sp.]
MRVIKIETERFQDYKAPSMYIGCIQCSGKCCIEAGLPIEVCINNDWRKSKIVEVSDDDIIKKYLSNPITEAIIFAGLEPFEQFDEIYYFIKKLRKEYNCLDDVVIYTGYTEEESIEYTNKLKQFENIIVKFGRYIPNQEKHYDEVLGVYLISNNQYAKRIS